jgi:hypothetical protein
MSKLLNHLLSVDYPEQKEFGTLAKREGYYITPDGVPKWGGMPYVRRFHGCPVSVHPGESPEFRQNVYCRLFGKRTADDHLPAALCPMGYWSPVMEEQSHTWPDDSTDIGRGLLEDAMVLYFEPSPDVREVQRRALAGGTIPVGQPTHLNEREVVDHVHKTLRTLLEVPEHLLHPKDNK